MPRHIIAPSARYRFTPEAARFAAARSNAARLERKLHPPPPDPALLPPEREHYSRHEAYLQKRLLRIREHIEKLSTLIDKAKDGLVLDRLCCALDRLAKLEFIMRGDALPGIMKPEARRLPAGPALKAIAWCEEETAPEAPKPEPAATDTTTGSVQGNLAAGI